MPLVLTLDDIGGFMHQNKAPVSRGVCFLSVMTKTWPSAIEEISLMMKTTFPPKKFWLLQLCWISVLIILKQREEFWLWQKTIFVAVKLWSRSSLILNYEDIFSCRQMQTKGANCFWRFWATLKLICEELLTKGLPHLKHQASNFAQETEFLWYED